MAVFKCKMCGGSLEVSRQSFAVCEYCGTKQTLPRLDSDRRANLYERANHFRRNNEFDKAMGIYEQLLTEDSTDAEAYWSLVLCRYGIEYVEDPTTRKRVPTVNRTQFTSVFDDSNYTSALQYADASQKAIFEEEAKAINQIQKGILTISEQEQPFDVFICYKETDPNGRRTPDSVLAADLYQQLTQEGFKVFFSRITLEDKLGTAYEPYIFAALNSARVMVVLGTKPEYINSVWVKNEWSRYLALIRNGANKTLIPAYRDMDPYDLPEEFAHLQAQDMGRLGFMQDLIRGIRKIAPPAQQTSAVSAGTAPLLKRAFLFLEDEDWVRADEFCEQVLNTDPECAQAYLGKLLADLQVKTPSALQNCDHSFDHNANYQKILRFGDEDLKNTLQRYSEHINDRNEKARLKSTYAEALTVMRKAGFSANPELDYRYAATLFHSLGDYQDAGQLRQQCLEQADTLQKGAEQAQKRRRQVRKICLTGAAVAIILFLIWRLAIFPAVRYDEGQGYLSSGAYYDAIWAFEDCPDYKDSADLLKEAKYQYAKEYVASWHNDEAVYEYLLELKAENYKDSAAIFEDAYTWKVEFVCCNTDLEDYETSITSIPNKADVLHIQFQLTGGKPQEYINLYHTIQWPGKTAAKSEWTWDSRTHGSGIGIKWENFEYNTDGEVVIRIYNADTDELLGTFTYPVGG